MTQLYEVLRDLLRVKAQAVKAPDTPYRDGYLDALEAAIEIVEEACDD